jgi:hypothetical protein
MRTNTYLYTFRKKLGLTIEEFATLIESNSGVLSMAEIGKRNLPSTSSLLATHWVAFFLTNWCKRPSLHLITKIWFTFLHFIA